MKYLKYLLYIILILGVLAFAAIKFYSTDQPKGQSGADADAIANKMLTALNKEAFDTLRYLEWEFFRPGQKYLWDKEVNKAIIKWDDNKVLMNLDLQEGKAYTGDVEQSGDEKKELMRKAWSNWCNDSFWMIAPFKVFDSGTTRELVLDEKGKENLLIKYASGGVTPGDSYLWILDENYRPTGYKMWTSIIPVKGMYSSWEGWEEHSGVMFSTVHKMAKMNMQMKGVKSGQDLSQLGYSTDPFKI